MSKLMNTCALYMLSSAMQANIENYYSSIKSTYDSRVEDGYKYHKRNVKFNKKKKNK